MKSRIPIILNFVLLSVFFHSCKTIETPASVLQPIPPFTDISADTVDITSPSPSNNIDLLIIIHNQKKEIHLLRTEIDMLKKNIKLTEINQNIEKVQDKFNKITSE